MLRLHMCYQLAASDMQTTIAQPSIPAVGSTHNSSPIPAPTSMAKDRPSSSGVKGLQLGSKSSGALATASLPSELAEEIAATETANAWGTDDLIDIQNDDDDWSAFESAPLSPPSISSHDSGSLNAGPAYLPPTRAASRPPLPKSPLHKSPALKSPSPAIYQALPGSFDTPISTPPTSQTPEPSWDDGNEWEAPPRTSVPPNLKPGSPAPALSKEDKAAEMARRKEERRQVRVSWRVLAIADTTLLIAHRYAQRTEEERREVVYRGCCRAQFVE